MPPLLVCKEKRNKPSLKDGSPSNIEIMLCNSISKFLRVGTPFLILLYLKALYGKLHSMCEVQSKFQQNLEQILRDNSLFQMIFSRSDQIKLPEWYVAGGCVTQTVWNWKMKLPPLHGIKDIDLVYFDPNETEADEEKQRLRIQDLFLDLPTPIDVINEARVHEWYPKKFGYSIPAYSSSDDGIRAWLPAFSVGVRIEKSQLKIFAPFGLSDTFNMIVRVNKRQITEEIYANMVKRLQRDWPTIQVIPFNQEQPSSSEDIELFH